MCKQGYDNSMSLKWEIQTQSVYICERNTFYHTLQHAPHSKSYAAAAAATVALVSHASFTQRNTA